MTQKLIEFLKELVREMENDEMDPIVYKELSEFYVRLMFLLSYKIKPMEDENIIKYLSLGYYIYSNIDLENEEPSSPETTKTTSDDDQAQIPEPPKQ
jgi:hypothetical protein